MNKAPAADNGTDCSDNSSSSETSDKQLDGPAAALLRDKRVHDDDDDDDDDTSHTDNHKDDPPAKVVNKEKKKVKRRQHAEDDDNSTTFPQLLMEVLENESLGSVISWLPHGLAFAILDKRKFARDIMGRYLKQSKFTSFTRKLNRWGFERVAKGPETGAYYHPLFQRNNLQLCMRMMCQKNRDPKEKDGSVASGAEADSTASSSQAKPTNEELRKAQSQKVANQGMTDRAQQVAALTRQAEARTSEARSNGHAAAAAAASAAAVSQDPNMLQLERMRQMLQMQLVASQGALDGHPQAASAQRLMEASAVSAAHEARLQQHQQQQQQHQQQQQLQLEDFRQRLEQQAQADQASWAGLDPQNSEAAMRHLQLLQQQRHMANQGAAEVAALRSHYGLSEADVSALQLQHHLSSMRHDQGRAQLEQLEEARQRHMWRQQMELAAQQQSQLWGMQQAAAQQQAAASQGGSQESAQRQLQESLAAQSYLQQHHQQQQQQQQQLLNSQAQQQQQQQLDPLTLQLIQQAMNGQFDPSTASRSRFQG